MIVMSHCKKKSYMNKCDYYSQQFWRKKKQCEFQASCFKTRIKY